MWKRSFGYLSFCAKSFVYLTLFTTQSQEIGGFLPPPPSHSIRALEFEGQLHAQSHLTRGRAQTKLGLPGYTAFSSPEPLLIIRSLKEG